MGVRNPGYFAEHGPGFMEPEVLPGTDGASIVCEPLGGVLAIEPWNFPLYQAARVAGPQLVAGNVVLMKHSEICPQTALAIEQLFRDAGAPEGVYTNVFLHVADVERVIADDAVQGVAFTGSDRTGSLIGELAGRHLKKSVLELGGSDAFIILDLDALGGLAGTVAEAAAATARQRGSELCLRQADHRPRRVLRRCRRRAGASISRRCIPAIHRILRLSSGHCPRDEQPTDWRVRSTMR